MKASERDHFVSLCEENDRANQAKADEAPTEFMKGWHRGQAKAYRRMAVRLRQYEAIEEG